ncbi:MAG: acetyl-CoA carboxylase biotin carboxyl carrier protein [Planctomycetaceae bacterium]|jgi:acetyl-CoA carboxylase biotin carboxyl carrier protein|nr:acetyl-CoA carboxylase biotin carboxyl carrier protein [Planctomycetaceae bacterium]
MVNSSNSGNDVFDIRRIKRLVELMQENDLTELDIQQSDMRIQLKRNRSVTAETVPTSMAVPTSMVSSMTVSGGTVPAASDLISVPPNEKNIQVIKSPMVGTFYAASKPDASPFVKVGDTVNADTTVCIIEAMKVYNEIQAECSGKIVAVLAKNGETVEFGKPLFRVIKDES